MVTDVQGRQVLEPSAVGVTMRGDGEVADLARHGGSRVVADADDVENVGDTDSLGDRALPVLTEPRNVEDAELLRVGRCRLDDRGRARSRSGLAGGLRASRFRSCWTGLAVLMCGSSRGRRVS